MGTNYNFSVGSDAPAWQWLPQLHGNGTPAYHGFDSAYDGSRYIYYVTQTGVTTTAASTTSLFRFDTWTYGYQYLAAATAGNRGMSLAYDSVRNVVIIIAGAGLTSWQVFNLNSTAVNICGVACNPWVLTTMTPVLPAAADYGSTIELCDPASIPTTIESESVTSGTTTTNIQDTAATSAFMDSMLYLQFRMTSGSRAGDKRIISAVVNNNNLTLNTALGGTPAAGDTYVIELPQGTATAGSSTTLTDSNAAWVVNSYSNHDVVITSGTGAGQKRRIASNTATVLTLASATTGNSNTGNWTTAPDATSVYKIQPSSDFLYYQAGSLTGLYRIDLATGASAPAWSTLTALPAATGGGGNVMWNSHGPFLLSILRGAATATLYLHNIGLNTTAAPSASYYWGGETITTGASSCFWRGQRKILIQKESLQRLYALNLATRQLEPSGTVPYAIPGAYDGKRLRQIRTADGADWLYAFRAGGAEVFRVPLEWGTLT